MARTRKRFWAKTLTLTAALLALVWVWSIMVSVGVSTSQGALGVYAGVIDFQRNVPVRSFDPVASAHVRSTWDARWWFGSFEFPQYGGGTLFFWYAPLWPFILLTGVPGVWMLVKTRKPTNPHACPACGYDRTGLPQSSTGPAACPECGPECGKGKDENR